MMFPSPPSSSALLALGPVPVGGSDARSELPSEDSAMFFADGVKDAPSLRISRHMPMLPVAASYVAPHWAGVEDLPESIGMPIVGSIVQAKVEDALDSALESATFVATHPAKTTRATVAGAFICAAFGCLPAFGADTPAKTVSAPELHVREPTAVALAFPSARLSHKLPAP